MGRRPRMKVYDYNQEFGGNYYQPMIQYINHKDTYGPFHTKADVYLPHTAEVRSNKYTNMRYQDKSSAKHNLDEFLVNAHAKQIKELNGTTGQEKSYVTFLLVLVLPFPSSIFNVPSYIMNPV